MKAASLNEIKKELSLQSPGKMLEICLRLAKYKKDNKELLTYLLFEAGDEQAYISSVKAEVDELFTEMNKSNVYLAKKTIRKILRTSGRYIRYSGSKETEADILIHFCRKLKSSGVPLREGTVLGNIYDQQVKKIDKAIQSLHEDLQYDYRKLMDKV